MTEYKLRIPSLSLKDGELREVEVEGMDDTKVLLSKIKGKVYATSSKCTHYGAPLVKGVLSSDGRLTCPWHGACFRVDTGDIEDAPAPDALTSFQLIEKDGEVYVKAEEKTLKAQRRQPYGKCTVKGQEEVVVVGGGSACFGVIEGLRTNGFTGKITVLSAEPSPPFDRTKLSKAMLSDVSKLEMRSISALADAGIEFLAKTEVTAVDTTKKTVTTKAGKSYGYTKLVLATGGAPNRLPLEGLKGDLGNVFTLRYLTDVKDITAAIGDKGGKKITVIGSSFIGMEAAYCLVGKGHEVTVIGTESVPLERVLGKEIGKIIQTNATKAKINVLMDATVEKGSPSSSNPKMIGSVGLKGGKTIECDLVILGVGVKPATAFLKENSSFKLLKDQSLEVDETFQVKGLKDVYAAGDIATYPYHGPGASKGGSPVRIEHWDVAMNAGRVIASSITAPQSPSSPVSGVANAKQFIPVFWSAQGGQLRYCGNTMITDGYDGFHLAGKPDDGKFVGYYGKNDEIVALCSMGMDPYMAKAATLMRESRMPTLSDVKGGTDILEISVVGIKTSSEDSKL